MVRVMASGVFDLLHPGHIYYLEEAKKLGDELFVVVAKDSTVRKQKHEPITLESMRLEMVKALKPVDKAVLGHEDDRYRIVEELKPDIIVLGYDQKDDEEKIKNDLKKRGLDVKVVRMREFAHDLSGTRKIIQKIIDWYSFQKKMEKVEK
ncbi:MAG: FAD synthase [Candidatus Thermoplasmatota archaeon]|nr:FAD synthase [Candidatus Thermoplasmatota archaeon]